MKMGRVPKKHGMSELLILRIYPKSGLKSYRKLNFQNLIVADFEFFAFEKFAGLGTRRKYLFHGGAGLGKDRHSLLPETQYRLCSLLPHCKRPVIGEDYAGDAL